MTNRLVNILQQLALKGSIRQLDYQFSRFIHQQALNANNAEQEQEQEQEQVQAQCVAFLAGVLSVELSKGHICLSLNDEQGMPVDLAAKIGLYGDAALELNQYLVNIDWAKQLQQSPLVGQSGEAVPLMFDGERLYLHRYWQYEVTLAARLNQLSAPIALGSADLHSLATLLDQLFARSYHYLFIAIQTLSESGKNSQVLRQQLVCDHLDIVQSDELNWSEIDKAITAATRIEQLTCLDDLIPNSACVNWQKVAASVALTRRFAVISGGPGTGKTTTVTKLLAALLHQSANSNTSPIIKLVAPTGKAAARLTESIGKAIAELSISPEIKTQIPTESSTVHRLLGALPNSAEFRHNKDNPLHLDILVVDEASMVDLSMMYKLVDALPSHARLILLGDKDQLASVEAGSVLGDICSFYQAGFSAKQSEAIAVLTGYQSLRNNNVASTPIADSLCMLQKSYRFDARSGIGQLAKAINSGQVKNLDTVWSRQFTDIEHFALNSDHYNQMIKILVEEYSHYLHRIEQVFERKHDQNLEHKEVTMPETQAQRAKAVLEAFSRCRLLCAIREGDFGVVGLNQRVERALSARNKIQTLDELWYQGRPVMVVRNDHGLGLYNGDIGICMRDKDDEEQRLKVFFELPDGSVKAVLPSRVPEHETAYAMTIHKSQGSEFDYTLMVLPPEFSPILTKELIYTGVTRAKNKLALFADIAVLKRGIKVKTERASGLVSRFSVS